LIIREATVSELKGLYVQTTQKRYIWTRKAQKKEKSIKLAEEWESKEEEKSVLLLCLTCILQPVGLGMPNQECKNSNQHSCLGH